MGEATTGDPFASVREVADALLYEGYVLYPYRASSGKNTNRWQFGVLMPPGYVADDPSERSVSQTEMIFEAPPDAMVRVRARFLHAQHRTGGDQPDWDEAVDRQVEVQLPIAQLRAQARECRYGRRGSQRYGRRAPGDPTVGRRRSHRGDQATRAVRRPPADNSRGESDGGTVCRP